MTYVNDSMPTPSRGHGTQRDSDGSTPLLSRCVAVSRRNVHLKLTGANHLVSRAVTAARFGHTDWSDQADFLHSASCDIDDERPFNLEPHLRGRVGNRLYVRLKHGACHAAFRLRLRERERES